MSEPLHWSYNAAPDGEGGTRWSCHSRAHPPEPIQEYGDVAVYGCSTCHETWVGPTHRKENS